MSGFFLCAKAEHLQSLRARPLPLQAMSFREDPDMKVQIPKGRRKTILDSRCSMFGDVVSQRSVGVLRVVPLHLPNTTRVCSSAHPNRSRRQQQSEACPWKCVQCRILFPAVWAGCTFPPRVREISTTRPASKSGCCKSIANKIQSWLISAAAGRGWMHGTCRPGHSLCRQSGKLARLQLITVITTIPQAESV